MAPSAGFDLRRLGDLVVFVNGDRSENYPAPGDFIGEGIPFISATDLHHGRVMPARRISETAFERLRDGKTQLGDTLYCLRGTLGKTAMVTDITRAAIASSLVILRPTRLVNQRFIYHVMAGPLGQGLAETLNNGSAQPNISVRSLQEVLVPTPAIEEQRAIAHILGTLDDKIELNRRTNETLEAMARALFRSWFVDFEPVRAKAAGRQPAGMDAETAALFPSEFVDSEKGKIPKGWSCQPLSAWASALSGGTPAKDTPAFWGGTIPWISPKAMMSLHADDSEEMVTEQALGKGTRLAPRGSCLVMVRGMGLHEEVRVSQARCDVAFNQDVKALVPKGISPSLLLFAMLHAQEDLLPRVESSGHGTGRLPSDILLSHLITMPPIETQMRLGAHLDALNSRIDSTRNESKALASLRDTLLPRLLSGELRVPDAERIVGTAT